jgi:hypothetical protein
MQIIVSAPGLLELTREHDITVIDVRTISAISTQADCEVQIMFQNGQVMHLEGLEFNVFYQHYREALAAAK